MKNVFTWLGILLAGGGGLAAPAQAQTCAAPTGISVSSPAPTTAVVSFSPVASAVAYVVRYNWLADSTAAGVVRRVTPASPVTLTGLRAAAAYRLVVGSICGIGDTVYANPYYFQTSNNPPAACAPVTSGQVLGITTTGATVSFTPASGAGSYLISYYAVGDSLNTHTTLTSNPSLVLSGLAAGTAYRVRIQTNCAGGATAGPVLLGFRTLATTVPCGAASNVVVTATSSSTATVSFTPGVGNTGIVVTYHLANDSTRRVYTATSPAIITGLLLGQTYYVQVVSQCGAGTSVVYTNSGSVAYGFRGAGPLASRNALGTGILAVYPSPAHDVLHLLVPAVPGASLAQATLLNALGQPIITQQLKLTGASTPAQLDLRGVRPGLYILRIAAGEHAASQRIVVE